MTNNFIEKQQATIFVEKTRPPASTNARSLFTHETGQILETLGKMFVNIPPFNDHIDQNTGQMLISIGKKLQST